MTELKTTKTRQGHFENEENTFKFTVEATFNEANIISATGYFGDESYYNNYGENKLLIDKKTGKSFAIFIAKDHFSFCSGNYYGIQILF